jgi:serine/threonine protein kinase
VANDPPAGTREKDALDTTLGMNALQQGLLTSAQLQEAMAEQARDLAERKTGPRPLASILVARGFLSHAQVQSLLLSPSAGGPLKFAPFGKYRLIRELGRGGMGVVYEALDSGLGRKVALKTMIVTPGADPQTAKMDEERFLRESQLSASLAKHPHIVGVYEAGVIQGRRYLAMELIQGKPMSDWWKDKSVTLKQEIEVLRAAALAVHHAHEAGIIHRDLKPQNILIDPDLQPHVTDFGLAKVVGENLSLSLTGAGMAVGTPAYISPEQAQGAKSTDRRTDVYALGVMLFEIATGRQPFQGATAMEILMKASNTPVPSASAQMKVRLSPVQAKGLDDICKKALAKKPADRYRDAAAFAADLTRWLDGDEVKVVGSTRRVARPPQQNRGPLIGVGVLALAAIGYFLLNGSTSAPPPPPTTNAAEAQRKLEAEKRKLAAAQQALEDRAKAAEAELQALKAKRVKAVEVRDPASLKPGLIGEYYGGANFDMPLLRRIDFEPVIQWKWGVPAWTDGPLEPCTFRWRGYLRVPETGAYLLQVICADGLRLALDDLDLLSRWGSHPGGVETTVQTLEKGYHRFVVEGLKLTGVGSLSFSWKKAETGEPVPTSTLHHDATEFSPLSQKASPDHLDQKGLPGAQEGEKLPILEGGAGTGVLPWGREKGFLLWFKTKTGDRLKLQFESPEAGEKTLILALGRSKNNGIVRIAVNGKEIVKELDLYTPNNHFLEHEFKKVPLNKGANELEFTMTGSNPAAVEWRKGDGVQKFSLDYLRIR